MGGVMTSQKTRNHCLTANIKNWFLEHVMPTHYANLDALIRREDFEVKSEIILSPAQLAATIQISQLEAESLMYRVLRKPDFQRETANWEPEKIADLIESFRLMCNYRAGCGILAL
jgi:BMFP domain-containing protein YqiC